jgi:hypothetical protein
MTMSPEPVELFVGDGSGWRAPCGGCRGKNVRGLLDIASQRAQNMKRPPVVREACVGKRLDRFSGAGQLLFQLAYGPLDLSAIIRDDNEGNALMSMEAVFLTEVCGMLTKRSAFSA